MKTTVTKTLMGGVDGLNGIWFAFYDKVTGGFVDCGEPSVAKRFTISSGNTEIITNSNLFAYQGVGCKTDREGTVTLTAKADGITVKSFKVTLIHAYDVYYNNSKIPSTINYTYTGSRDYLYFALYDKVDKTNVILCTSGGDMTTAYYNFVGTPSNGVVSKKTGVRLLGSGRGGYDVVFPVNYKGSCTITFTYGGVNVGSVKVNVN
ncbi:MAG: hypothetical protein IKW99_01980 [Bacteroidales bacterium]|nr:hypothetical protein [Bacteroidales bacterium]